MTSLTSLLQQSWVERLGWTLVHFLWQGAVVACLAGVVFWLLRHRSAQARYLAGCMALLAMLVVPLATFWLVPASSPASSPAVIASIVEPATGPSEARVLDNGARPELEPISPRIEPRLLVGQDSPPAPAVAPKALSWPDLAVRLRPLLPWLVAAWLLGVLVLLARHLGGWVRVQRLRCQQTKPVSAPILDMLGQLIARLRVSRPVQVLQSALVEVPTVIGWLRPVILFPASALTGLSTEQLEALLAHELAHIRRHDYLVNLLQTLVETLLFYHPAVWWLSQRIRQERENCCDDLATAVCRDRIAYARALLAMEELRAEDSQLVLAASGGSLLSRVRRLIGLPQTNRRPVARSLAAVLAVGAILAVLVGWQIAAGTAKDASAATQKSAAPGSELLVLKYSEKLRKLAIDGKGNLSFQDPDGAKTRVAVKVVDVRRAWMDSPSINLDNNLILFEVLPGNAIPKNPSIKNVQLYHGHRHATGLRDYKVGDAAVLVFSADGRLVDVEEPARKGNDGPVPDEPASKKEKARGNEQNTHIVPAPATTTSPSDRARRLDPAETDTKNPATTDSLNLASQPLKLLDDRLRISMPEGAKIEAREANIMAAPEAIEEETRVVFEQQGKKLVLIAYDTFNTARKDMEEWNGKMSQDFSEEGYKTVLLVSKPDFRVFLTTVPSIDTSGEAILVCAARVVNRDETIQELFAYANPEAAKDLKGVRDLYARILKTLAPGAKRLDSKAGTRTLDVYSKTMRLALDLPEGYVATLQRGPDFLVHRLCKMVPFGSDPHSLSVYVGNNPGYHHEKSGDADAKTEEIRGTLIGKEVKWFKYAGRGSVCMEAIRPTPEIEDGTQLHVFFSASSEKELAAVQKIAGTMRFVEVKSTADTLSSHDGIAPTVPPKTESKDGTDLGAAVEQVTKEMDTRPTEKLIENGRELDGSDPARPVQADLGNRTNENPEFVEVFRYHPCIIPDMKERNHDTDIVLEGLKKLKITVSSVGGLGRDGYTVSIARGDVAQWKAMCKELLDSGTLLHFKNYEVDAQGFGFLSIDQPGTSKLEEPPVSEKGLAGKTAIEANFTAEVKWIEQAGRRQATVVSIGAVDLDWLVGIEIRSIEKPARPFDKTGPMVLAIHSPAKTFAEPGEKVPGKSYSFKVMGNIRDGKPTYHWVEASERTKDDSALLGASSQSPVGSLKANPVRGERVRFESNGKIGFLDQNGKTVIEPIYDQAEDFSYGLATVNLGAERDMHVPAKRGGKWGYIDTKGRVVVPITLESASPFSDGLAKVGDEKGTRFIDTLGKTVVDLGDSARSGNFSEGFCPVYEDQSLQGGYFKTRYIDHAGKTALTVDGYGEEFHEGLAILTVRDPANKELTRSGFIDRKGQVAIKPTYAEVRPFSEGLAAVRPEKTTPFYGMGDRWGYIDASGKYVIPLRFNEAHPFVKGIARVHEGGTLRQITFHAPPEWEGGQWLSIDKMGKEAKVRAAEEPGQLAPDPVAELNRQIEKFNAERNWPNPDRGVFPIDQRVARIEYDAKQDTITCLDQKGETFLTLKRQKDGRFHGTIEVKFHELAKPGERHDWGTVTIEFLLPKETVFPQSGTPTAKPSGGSDTSLRPAPKPDSDGLLQSQVLIAEFGNLLADAVAAAKKTGGKVPEDWDKPTFPLRILKEYVRNVSNLLHVTPEQEQRFTQGKFDDQSTYTLRAKENRDVLKNMGMEIPWPLPYMLDPFDAGKLHGARLELVGRLLFVRASWPSAEDLKRFHSAKGKTKEEVRRLLGNPKRIEGKSGAERWHYPWIALAIIDFEGDIATFTWYDAGY